MRHLLDTNIVSDLVRRPQGPVAQRVRQIGEASVCTSIIVAAELRYGATKRGSARLSAQLDAVLGALEVSPFEASADSVYGVLRAIGASGPTDRRQRSADRRAGHRARLRPRHR